MQRIGERPVKRILKTCNRELLIRTHMHSIDLRLQLVIKRTVIGRRAEMTVLQTMIPIGRTHDVLPRETDIRHVVVIVHTHLITTVETRDDDFVILAQLTRIGQVKIHKMVPDTQSVRFEELAV